MKATLTFFLLTGLFLTTRPSFATSHIVPDDTLRQATSTPQNTPEANVSLESGQLLLLRGTVQGINGPLPGATVWLHGSPTIAVTNSEGAFQLPVPSDASRVEVTYSYGGLEEETKTLAITQAPQTLHLLRPATGQETTLTADLKAQYQLLKQKVRNVTSK